jgi:hypothetical protein
MKLKRHYKAELTAEKPSPYDLLIEKIRKKDEEIKKEVERRSEIIWGKKEEKKERMI